MTATKQKAGTKPAKSRDELRGDKWARLREAIQSDNQADIDKAAVDLSLTDDQVSFAIAVLDELQSLEATVKATEKAGVERDALALTLDKIAEIRPSSTQEAEALSREEIDLRQRHGKAMHDAAVHVRASEFVAGTRYRFHRLLGIDLPDVGQLAGLSPRLRNMQREMGLDNELPLETPPAPMPKRKRLVAKVEKSRLTN